MIPLTRPLIGQTEQDAVSTVLRSGMLVQGAKVAEFETQVASASGRAFGIAVSSGTAALSLALEAIGIGQGDEVLVPALTWPSPAHAAARLGARVVLVDVHPAEWNSTAEAFAKARTSKTRAAIVIDQFGNPARAAEIRDALPGLPIIEDAACALGSRFTNGAPCGSLGLMGCFSFHPRKVLTTGEGGVITTDDAEMADRLQMLRNHGQRAPGQFESAGGNYRLTEIAGAMGVAQMARLEFVVTERRRLAGLIKSLTEDRLIFQSAPLGAQPNYQTLGAVLPDAIDPDDFVKRARERGVQAGRLSYDLSAIGTLNPGVTPNAAKIAGNGIALPLFPTMTSDEAEQVASVVLSLL